MNNIDKFDDEISNRRIHVGFMINIRHIINTIDDIIDSTGEFDNKYPKSELLKLWGSMLFLIQFLLVVSVNVFMIVTLPLLFFNFYGLLQIFKAYKRFKYKRTQLILLTLFIIVVEFILANLIRSILF